MKRLTSEQHELLSLIKERTDRDDSGNLKSFFYPHKDQWCDALKKTIAVDGAGCASMIKSFIRNGLVVKPNNETRGAWSYCAAITEDGILAIEEYREATGFYVK